MFMGIYMTQEKFLKIYSTWLGKIPAKRKLIRILRRKSWFFLNQSLLNSISSGKIIKTSRFIRLPMTMVKIFYKYWTPWRFLKNSSELDSIWPWKIQKKKLYIAHRMVFKKFWKNPRWIDSIFFWENLLKINHLEEVF